jgi:hypothetical protein
MGPGTFVVLPSTLCAALSPFRSVPLSAQGSRGGYGEGTLDERIEFPPVSPDTATLRTIIYLYTLALRDLEASDTYRALHGDFLCSLQITVDEGLCPTRSMI